MPEPTADPAATVDPANPNPQDPQKGTENPVKTGDGSQDFDSSKLTEAQLEKVLEDQRLWKSDRLTKLREKAKIADNLEAEKAKAAEAEAIKKGEFDTVLKTKDEQIATLTSQIQTIQQDSAIISAAVKAGAVDPSIVAKLIDRSNIKIEENGTITGVEEAVTALLTTSPYLKGNGAAPTIGAPSNPDPNGQQPKKFKASQLRDHKFYMENEKEIQEAVRLGQIEQD